MATKAVTFMVTVYTDSAVTDVKNDYAYPLASEIEDFIAEQDGVLQVSAVDVSNAVSEKMFNELVADNGDAKSAGSYKKYCVYRKERERVKCLFMKRMAEENLKGNSPEPKTVFADIVSELSNEDKGNNPDTIYTMRFARKALGWIPDPNRPGQLKVPYEWYDNLAGIVKHAVMAGLEKEKQLLIDNGGDYGTCNYDTPVLYLDESWDMDYVLAAIRKNDIKAYPDPSGNGIRIIIRDLSQGGARAENANEVARIIENEGYDCSVASMID